jgi:hypothetical protein
MTLTTTPSGFGLDELEPGELLERVTQAETAERAAALRKMELAVQWCVLHPATADTGAAVWGDAGLPGLTECDETLGGEGCPTVSAFAPEPFAAALAVSTMTGMQLLADALDLVHRLPAIWRRVQRLEIPAWKARRVAQATHHLSREAAAHVDAQLADRLASCSATLIDRVVAQAAATHDPELHAEREQTGRDAWDVRLSTGPTAAGPAPPSSRRRETPSTSRASTTWSATTPPTWRPSATPMASVPARPRPSA